MVSAEGGSTPVLEVDGQTPALEPTQSVLVSLAADASAAGVDQGAKAATAGVAQSEEALATDPEGIGEGKGEEKEKKKKKEKRKDG